MHRNTAKITVEIEIEFEYSYSPGQPETPPSYFHGGLPADPDEWEIAKIEKFLILEPRRDPLPEGGWSKTHWIGTDILPHIEKYMPRTKFEELFTSNDYLNDLFEDAIQERER